MTENNIKILNTRDIRFDILRVIGLLCIILAHTYKLDINHPILYQLRNFDVPLMVIISGAVFGITTIKKKIRYINYLQKRVVRLLLPVWLFLSVFFIFFYVMSIISNSEYAFSKMTILLSYTLVSGIGYVWIIRVFLLVAAVAPLILVLHEKIKNDWIYFGILLTFYMTYELVYMYYTSTGFSLIDKIIEYVGFYLIPFGCLFGLGLRLPAISKKNVLIIMALNLMIFVILGKYYFGAFIPTELYKYSPRIYYLSYAVSVSLFLYLLTNSKLTHVLDNSIVLFISSSSMTIYLWHIFFLYCWDFSINARPLWTNSFIIMFFVVFGLSILTTYIQFSTKTWIKLNFDNWLSSY